jgi:hypothetical protein
VATIVLVFSYATPMSLAKLASIVASFDVNWPCPHFVSFGDPKIVTNPNLVSEPTKKIAMLSSIGIGTLQ